MTRSISSSGKPRGFSLVEAGLAFVILGLAMVPIIGIFASSGQQARQTADYVLASTLEEKVAEELRVSGWENVHLGQILGSDPSLGAEASIVDGLSPFFAVIEDLNAPIGELTARVDPGITKDYRTLYREGASYRLGMSSHEVLLTTGATLQIDLGLSWNDFQQHRQLSLLPVAIPKRQPTIPPPLEVQDRSRADDQIRALLYPTRSGRSLSQIAASSAGDLGLMRAVGDAALLSKAVFDSATQFDAEITQAANTLAAATTPVAKVRARVALARIQERRAAIAMQILAYLSELLGRVDSASRLDGLASSRPDRAACGLWLSRLRKIAGTFDLALVAARDGYAVAYGPPEGKALPPRVRVRVFMRLLEAAKLAALTLGPADTTAIAKLVAEFEKVHAGRNENFAEFARFESRSLTDVPSLEAAYPMARVKAYRDFRNLCSRVVPKVRQAL